MTRWGWIAAMALLVPGAGSAQGGGLACERCHGELELLRQHVQTLEAARALLVRADLVAGSAHGAMACAACHAGYGRFPHPESARSETCASCHADAAAAWGRGAHAGGEGVEAVPCATCHGIHDVVPADSLVEGPAVREMSARCVECHETQRLPVEAPHQDHAGCYACHAAHEVVPPELPESWMAAANQARVCGACHDTVAAAWAGDVHGRAVQGSEELERGPTCSSCHGAHPVVGSGEDAFSAAAVERCVACHEKAGRTFFGSYHGKATALGSQVVATCAHCHGAHGIEPASSPESRVAEANLVETCGECHEHARPAFVKYDAHPDPMDRARNPVLFYSFWFMNTLLIGTLAVFGLHTLLWWIRIGIDRRRGGAQAGGEGE
ncbi:MAG TPA: cytochrome c3 family protein [Longimicrobiales bacterium]|nr:cytochrome c3 family protein [Longimicrobiales bacterium]